MFGQFPEFDSEDKKDNTRCKLSRVAKGNPSFFAPNAKFTFA